MFFPGFLLYEDKSHEWGFDHSGGFMKEGLRRYALRPVLFTAVLILFLVAFFGMEVPVCAEETVEYDVPYKKNAGCFFGGENGWTAGLSRVRGGGAIPVDRTIGY